MSSCDESGSEIEGRSYDHGASSEHEESFDVESENSEQAEDETPMAPGEAPEIPKQESPIASNEEQDVDTESEQGRDHNAHVGDEHVSVEEDRRSGSESPSTSIPQEKRKMAARRKGKKHVVDEPASMKWDDLTCEEDVSAWFYSMGIDPKNYRVRAFDLDIEKNGHTYQGDRMVFYFDFFLLGLRLPLDPFIVEFLHYNNSLLGLIPGNGTN